MSQPHSITPPATSWPLALILSILCLIVRLPALLALPIFGDEAIYLRWAQLIDHGHIWISLCDPKPPLHFWLIAALSLSADPLLPARLLSVLAAVLAIPLTLSLCNELAALARTTTPATGRLTGLLAAVLLIFCPFLAFYQRLATADALFLTENLAAAFLSLRWTRRLAQNQNAWPTALLLALTLGLALLTRQGLSYTLCLLPPTALGIHVLRNRQSQSQLPMTNYQLPIPRALAQLTLTALLALALWSPYLVANLQQNAANNQHSIADEIKTRILYQSDFTNSAESRLHVAARNFQKTFIPSYLNDHAALLAYPTQGWLYFYLTPPIFLASLLGLAYLLSKRQWRITIFLLAWITLMLAPPIFLGNVIYSRYVLAAVPPLLIAAAFLLADLLTWILSRKLSPLLLWPVAALILAALLIAPIHHVGLQIKNPDRQTLTVQDRYQYLTGWSAGGPTSHAIQALTRFAATGPIVLITDSAWGNPADAAWLYLSPNPNVTLYYTIPSVDGPLLLNPTPTPRTYLLRQNKYLFTHPEPVLIPPGVPIFYLTNDPVHAAAGDFPADPFFRKNNPNLGPPISFYGTDGPPGDDHVDIFPLHAPPVPRL